MPLQNCNNSVVELRNNSVDSPLITQRMKEFHEKLLLKEAVAAMHSSSGVFSYSEAGVCSSYCSDNRVPRLSP